MTNFSSKIISRFLNLPVYSRKKKIQVGHIPDDYIHVISGIFQLTESVLTLSVNKRSIHCSHLGSRCVIIYLVLLNRRSSLVLVALPIENNQGSQSLNFAHYSENKIRLQQSRLKFLWTQGLVIFTLVYLLDCLCLSTLIFQIIIFV